MDGSYKLGVFRINFYPIDCAMHGAVDIKYRKMWYCFHLPTWVFGRYWPPYFYVSPDATPSSSVFKLGRVL